MIWNTIAQSITSYLASAWA